MDEELLSSPLTTTTLWCLFSRLFRLLTSILVISGGRGSRFTLRPGSSRFGLCFGRFGRFLLGSSSSSGTSTGPAFLRWLLRLLFLLFGFGLFLLGDRLLSGFLLGFLGLGLFSFGLVLSCCFGFSTAALRGFGGFFLFCFVVLYTPLGTFFVIVDGNLDTHLSSISLLLTNTESCFTRSVHFDVLQQDKASVHIHAYTQAQR